MRSDRTGAEAEFRGILALDSTHRLDPGVFSPAIVQFYQEVRTNTASPWCSVAPRRRHRILCRHLQRRIRLG